MGAAESVAQEPAAQVTPCRPIENRHLSRVCDPRSPTTGIPRTPIEVGDSPTRSPAAEQAEEVEEPLGIADPRSPTHGIARTPLRPSLHASLNLLAKQLSEVFVSEDSGIAGSPAIEEELVTEGSPVTEEPAAEGSPAIEEELVTEGSPVADEEPVAEGSPVTDEELAAAPPGEPAVAERPSTPSAEVPEPAASSPAVPAAAAPAQPTPPAPKQRSHKSPRNSGAKKVRQRSRKALISAAPGRSPLKILQEDNSPSTAVQNRQLKKLSFQSEAPSSLRSLKLSHSSWQTSHNKENAQYTQSES